jgi:hypothetical protein
MTSVQRKTLSSKIFRTKCQQQKVKILKGNNSHSQRKRILNIKVKIRTGDQEIRAENRKYRCIKISKSKDKLAKEK